MKRLLMFHTHGVLSSMSRREPHPAARQVGGSKRSRGRLKCLHRCVLFVMKHMSPSRHACLRRCVPRSSVACGRRWASSRRQINRGSGEVAAEPDLPAIDEGGYGGERLIIARRHIVHRLDHVEEPHVMQVGHTGMLLSQDVSLPRGLGGPR